MRYEDIDRYAQQLPNGSWILAFWHGCACEYYAFPVNESHPVTAGTLENLAKKRNGVWKGKTREEVVRACWLEHRYRSEDGGWLEMFRDEEWPLLVYVTARQEAGWVSFEFRGQMQAWMKWQTSAPFLTSRGIKAEKLATLTALAESVDRLDSVESNDAWRSEAMAWLARFEAAAVGTRLERKHRVYFVNDLCREPEFVEGFRRHLERLGEPWTSPEENLTAFEEMIVDELGAPGAWTEP
jgi:hypothetical protein